MQRLPGAIAALISMQPHRHNLNTTARAAYLIWCGITLPITGRAALHDNAEQSLLYSTPPQLRLLTGGGGGPRSAHQASLLSGLGQKCLEDYFVLCLTFWWPAWPASRPAYQAASPPSASDSLITLPHSAHATRSSCSWSTNCKLAGSRICSFDYECICSCLH